MKQIKYFSAVFALGMAFTTYTAHADVVTDAHGNVGYDTAEECDAAVLAGTAKFYQSFTHKSPLIRKGEAKVETATISQLGEEYKHGACDIGTGRKLGRDGVSTALQGKFIPFSPDMPINVYTDSTGKATRVTMAQCDNWFSGDAPRAVVVPAKPEPVVEAPAPVVEPAVVAAPVVAKAAGVRPYVFGTLGALHQDIEVVDDYRDKDARFAGQIGLGAQFNKYLGAEALYQGGQKHKFGYKYTDTTTNTTAQYTDRVQTHTGAARLTLGTDVSEKLRVFAKAGAAYVEHKVKTNDGDSVKIKYTTPTAGVGVTYNFTDNVALRADYDHYFRKTKDGLKVKAGNYLGAGVQFKF